MSERTTEGKALVVHKHVVFFKNQVSVQSFVQKRPLKWREFCNTILFFTSSSPQSNEPRPLPIQIRSWKMNARVSSMVKVVQQIKCYDLLNYTSLNCGMSTFLRGIYLFNNKYQGLSVEIYIRIFVGRFHGIFGIYIERYRTSPIFYLKGSFL